MVRRWLTTAALVPVLCLLMGATAQASTLTWSVAGQVEALGQPVEAMTCPSATSCTALVYNDAQDTAEYSFAPVDPARHSAGQVDSGGYPGELACASAKLCAFGDAQGNVTAFDPTDPDEQDDWSASAAAIQALACPSSTECVLVDTQGSEQTFDPTALGTASASGQLPPGANWLSCPATTQCTVAGTNGVQTFDPLAPPSKAPAGGDSFDGGTALLGLSCPSVDACIAIDYNANAVPFDPQSIGAGTPQSTGAVEAGALSQPGQPLSISCASESECMVVSESGDAYEGDPQTGAWIPEALEDDGMAAVACPSAALCVGADLDAGIFMATPITSGLGAGLGSVTGTKTRSQGFTVSLLCGGTANDRCAFTLRLAAGSGASRTAVKTFTDKPGLRTATIAVTRTAGRALAQRHSLAVRFTVTQKRIGFTATLLNRASTLRTR